ncbi:hypothetical protein, partial [Mycoplasmopsis bovis]|uniref:hypothetical protein n=1 Tax=Mycoplasmopsis bovis TaxID=28903 RepID=UPI003D2B5439
MNLELSKLAINQMYLWFGVLKPPFFSTISLYSRDNRLKRVFGYNSYFWRSPDDTEKGIYPGWKKTDAT